MKARAVSQASWHHHPNVAAPSIQLRNWLKEQGSLTTRLQNHCTNFRLECIKQRIEPCASDEYKQLGLTRPCMVPMREVILYCDNLPVVFAHTVTTPNNIASNWPMFRKLGNRSLGSLLFSNRDISRGMFQYSRLEESHKLVKRIHAALPEHNETTTFFARRCLFKRKRGAMLVTEIFLPEILNLHIRPVA